MFKKSLFFMFFVFTCLLITGCYQKESKKTNYKNYSVISSGDYLIDSDYVYYLSTGDVISGADVKTFSILHKSENSHMFSYFAKDINNVYFGPIILFSGFDYNTLTGDFDKIDCGLGCFKDKNFYYKVNSIDLIKENGITKNDISIEISNIE